MDRGPEDGWKGVRQESLLEDDRRRGGEFREYYTCITPVGPVIVASLSRGGPSPSSPMAGDREEREHEQEPRGQDGDRDRRELRSGCRGRRSAGPRGSEPGPGGPRRSPSACDPRAGRE